VCDCQETKQLWDRIAKLESDKTVLTEALESIIAKTTHAKETLAILQKALKAVKESE
jgi:hypothetical protein